MNEPAEEMGRDPPRGILRLRELPLDQEARTFERYERRALSRPKFAIRDWMQRGSIRRT